MSKQPLGITLLPSESKDATGVYESVDGIEVFYASSPYLLNDGKSLAPPIPVFDAGGPVFTDSMGNMQASLAINAVAPETDFVTWDNNTPWDNNTYWS